MCSADNTWEPEENLDCPELIAAFHTAQKGVVEKPDSNKRKPSTDEPETEESKAKKKKEGVCPPRHDSAKNWFICDGLNKEKKTMPLWMVDLASCL